MSLRNQPARHYNSATYLWTGLPIGNHSGPLEVCCWPLFSRYRQHLEIGQYYNNLDRYLQRAAQHGATQIRPLDKPGKRRLIDICSLVFSISHQFEATIPSSEDEQHLLYLPRLKLHYAWVSESTITLNFVFSEQHALAILKEAVEEIHKDTEDIGCYKEDAPPYKGAMRHFRSPDLVVLLGNDNSKKQFNPFDATHFLVHAVYTPFLHDSASQRESSESLAGYQNVEQLFENVNSHSPPQHLMGLPEMTKAILMMLTYASTREMRLEIGALANLMVDREMFQFDDRNLTAFTHFRLEQ